MGSVQAHEKRTLGVMITYFAYSKGHILLYFMICVLSTSVKMYRNYELNTDSFTFIF